MKIFFQIVLLFFTLLLHSKIFGQFKSVEIANNIDDFFIQNLKKSQYVNSWQLKARVFEVNLSEDSYNDLINIFSGNDSFSDLIDEKKLKELTKEDIIINNYSYELNFSRSDFRLKKEIPLKYVASFDKTRLPIGENNSIVFYENCINGLSSTYNSAENILRLFKSNLDPFVQAVADYGIDICLLPFDGLLKDVLNRKINIKLNCNTLEIKTSINEGCYEKLKFVLKDGFIYCLSTQAEMIPAKIHIFYAGYQKPSPDLKIYFPRLKALLMKSKRDNSTKGIFYIVDSWELKTFNENDFDITISKNAKIENIE